MTNKLESIIMNETKPIKFLLVEDDDAHAKLVYYAFKRAKIQNPIDRIKDGDDVLPYLRQEGEFEDKELPEVILLDLNIPGKNGLEVLRIIKEDEQLRKIPVVILTTSQSISDRDMAYTRYANSYLVKPVNAERFKKLIEEMNNYWAVWNVLPE